MVKCWLYNIAFALSVRTATKIREEEGSYASHFIVGLVRPLLVEGSVIVIFYVIFLMCSAVIIYYFGKIFFPINRKQGVNNCFKSLISSVFTTVKIISGEKKRERQTDRQTERQRERQRETETETERQRNRETERQRERERQQNSTKGPCVTLSDFARLFQ